MAKRPQPSRKRVRKTTRKSTARPAAPPPPPGDDLLLDILRMNVAFLAGPIS